MNKIHPEICFRANLDFERDLNIIEKLDFKYNYYYSKVSQVSFLLLLIQMQEFFYLSSGFSDL